MTALGRNPTSDYFSLHRGKELPGWAGRRLPATRFYGSGQAFCEARGIEFGFVGEHRPSGAVIRDTADTQIQELPQGPEAISPDGDALASPWFAATHPPCRRCGRHASHSDLFDPPKIGRNQRKRRGWQAESLVTPIRSQIYTLNDHCFGSVVGLGIRCTAARNRQVDPSDRYRPAVIRRPYWITSSARDRG